MSDEKLLLLAAASALAITPAIARDGKPTFSPWGVDLTAMDSAVKPGDDFFDYVNGAWAKRTDIAADRTFVGIDSVLNDQIDRDVRAIVEDMAKDPAASGLIGQQVGDFYASWMDLAAIDAKGAAPAKPYLERNFQGEDKGELIDLFATVGYASPVGVSIYPDLANPTQYAVYASQASRPSNAIILAAGANTTLIARLSRLHDSHPAARRIPDAPPRPTVFRARNPIAKSLDPRAESRIEKIYNPMDLPSSTASRGASSGIVPWPHPASAT